MDERIKPILGADATFDVSCTLCLKEFTYHQKTKQVLPLGILTNTRNFAYFCFFHLTTCSVVNLVWSPQVYDNKPLLSFTTG